MNEVINTNDLLNNVGINKQQLYRYCLGKVLVNGEDYKLINGRNYVYFYSALSKLIEHRKRTKSKQETKIGKNAVEVN